MAIPHEIQRQIINKRLTGKTGKARIEEIRDIESGLPRYKDGPYADIKKWLKDEVKKAKTISRIKHLDWLGVQRQGDMQFMLVGCPSSGKSSLINKLSGLQTKIAAYAFTTLKPLPGTVRINGADFQIVDLPGLLEGAVDDVGGGRRLIGLVKTADGILLMHDLSAPINETDKLVTELKKAQIEKLTIVIGNKIDLAGARENFEKLKQRFSDCPVIGISTITGEGLEDLKKKLWELSKLIRVYLKDDEEPMILKKESTVQDLLEKIHKDLVKKFKFANVTGKSAKFPNQQVGLMHVFEDEDRVEFVLER